MKTFTYLLAAGLMFTACSGKKAASADVKESQKEEKLVCLSFDDGPNTTTTKQFQPLHSNSNQIKAIPTTPQQP